MIGGSSTIGRYLAREIATAVVFVLVAFLALFAFFDFINELDDVGRAGYSLAAAAIYVLLTLPDDPQRYPVAGKVGWITPSRAAANRTQGVGVRFPGDEKSDMLKHKIEEILGSALASDRPTQTL